jgi:hypothetical protein
LKKNKELYDYSAFEQPGLRALIKTLEGFGFVVETKPKFERGMWRFKASRKNWN